jgi:hypothetical protein
MPDRREEVEGVDADNLFTDPDLSDAEFHALYLHYFADKATEEAAAELGSAARPTSGGCGRPNRCWRLLPAGVLLLTAGTLLGAVLRHARRQVYRLVSATGGEDPLALSTACDAAER